MALSLFSNWHRVQGVFLSLCLLCLLSACKEELVEPAFFGTVTGTVLDAREAALDSIDGMLRRNPSHALTAIRTHGLEPLLEAEAERLRHVPNGRSVEVPPAPRVFGTTSPGIR